MIDFILQLEQDLQKFHALQRLSCRHYLHVFNPRFLPVGLVRVANLFYRHDLRILSRIVSLKNQIIFGCDIARGAAIGGGLYLPHPNGIVIGEYVRIGRNCIIHQGVTLGARGENHALSNPVVGNEVEIGSGAKILGHVTIGDYVRIGANAVVLSDVPDKGVAVGIPAKTVSYRSDV